MKDCLVTKFKATVDNDNLIIFKHLRLKVGQCSNTFLQITFSDSVRVLLHSSVASDNFVVEEMPYSANTPATFTSGTKAFNITSTDSDAYLDVYDAEKVTSVSYNSTINDNLTAKDFNQCYNLTRINANGDGYMGGDIKEFGGLTSLTRLELDNYRNRNYPVGTIEEFVKNQRENGRTTCDSLNLGIGTTLVIGKVRFNNTFLTSDNFPYSGALSDRLLLSWTATTITVNQTTIEY